MAVTRFMASLVTVWLGIAGAAVSHMPSRFVPRVDIYYTIASYHGGNLGVDPEGYHSYLVNLQEKGKDQLGQNDYPNVVHTLASDGDFEKWSLLPFKRSKGKFYVVNKATGLYLTGQNTDHPHLTFIVAPKIGRHDTGETVEDQAFAFQLEGDGRFFQIVLQSKGLSVTSEGTPDPEGPVEVNVRDGKPSRNSSLALWEAELTSCDPHPGQDYALKQKYRSRYLRFPDANRNLLPVYLASAIEGPASIVRFIPTKEDKKVFYIHHPVNDKVVDISVHSNLYGLPAVQNDKNESDLYQQYYILRTPDRRGCIIGNAANYRYFGVSGKQHPLEGADATQTAHLLVQKEQYPIVDEIWELVPTYGESRQGEHRRDTVHSG